MKPVTFLAALLGLAACDAQVESRKAAVPAEQTAPAAAPLTAAGPAATVQPDTEEGNQWAAAVVELTPLTRQGDRTVKLFGTAGGDPAINGLYTYLSAYSAPDGWTRNYMLGDFNSWEVIEESPTRVVLKVSRSWIEEGTGDVKTAEEKLIVDLPATPETPVKVTPAT